VNPSEFIGEFRAEAAEKLDVLSAQLLKLERNHADLQPIRDMFLAAHTVKGGASMLRLGEVEYVAHALEDILGHLRDGHRTMDSGTADLLFQTLDHLRLLIETATPGSSDEPGARSVALAAQLRSIAPTRLTATASTGSRKRALLVEDSPTVRLLHGLLLADAGFDVEAAADGHAALALAATEPFDLVVSGIQTRGLRGYELATALRASAATRDMPMILTTSDDDELLRRRVADLGVQALVRKASPTDTRLVEIARSLAS
jgi:chemotaxis protein histidine kinase CheA